MGEIGSFRINHAEAERDADGLVVRLYYPEQPETLTTRLKADPAFGTKVFETLICEGYAPLADAHHAIVPPSAGCAYLLADDTLVVHRRDGGAPTNPGYHSISAGFPMAREDVWSAEGILRNAARETAEETLLITNEKRPWLIAPDDLKEETLATAKRLGIELPLRLVSVEQLVPNDTLEAYAGGKRLFSLKTFLDFMYTPNIGMNALQIRRLPLSSDEVLPIDCEGTEKNGSFTHFNRESYLLALVNLENRQFGTPLEHPRVYRTQIRRGKPDVYTPTYSHPFLGPDNVPVNHPHLWAPEDLLTRVLDGIGVEGYKGKWTEHQYKKERAALAGGSALPRDVVVR